MRQQLKHPYGTTPLQIQKPPETAESLSSASGGIIFNINILLFFHEYSGQERNLKPLCELITFAEKRIKDMSPLPGKRLIVSLPF